MITEGTLRRRSFVQARHRGAASLAVTMIMMALAALVVLYANRGQIFEQRISANQSRATSAFEVAEAGIEWAIARMNDGTKILPGSSGTCLALSSPDTNAKPFADAYLQTTSDPSFPDNPLRRDFTPQGNARVACSIAEATGAMTCRCPTSGDMPSLPSPGTRNFLVTFLNVSEDNGSIRIRSEGCINSVTSTGTAALCTVGTSSDASSRIEVLVKYVPGLGSMPSAALTCGSYATVCGSYNITNADERANGILISCGGPVRIGQGTYQSGPMPEGAQNCGGGGGQTLATLAGTPLSAAIIYDDAGIQAARTSSDAMFSKYFGMTLAQYKQPPTCTITSAGDLDTRYKRADKPCRRFWVEGDIQVSGLDLGTATDPVMIASADAMTFSGNSRIWGVIYGDNVAWNHNGTGNAEIHGAIVTRGNYYSNGNGSIIYDATTMANLGKGSGSWLRVPGSWKDFQ